MYQVLICISIMVMSLATCGCSSSSWYSKFNWKAEDYFDDPKVIALCKAIQEKDIAKIDKLVADGADVNAKGKGNMTPLLWAFPENKPEVFKRILEFGGDPNIEVTSDFNTKNQGIRQGDSVLHLAAGTAFPDYFKYVMQHGGNPNLIRGNKYKDSPLITVVSGNSPNKQESVQILIDKGADINYVNLADETALLMAASWGGQFDIAIQLLEAGASFNLYMESSGTFVHFILKNKKFTKQRYSEKQSRDYDAIIKILESKGADLVGAEKDNAVWIGGGRVSPKRIQELKKRYADELEAKQKAKEQE